MNIFTKIFGFIALIASGAALFFRGQMFKSREARVKDREKVKDKAHEISRRSTIARHEGEKEERKKTPIDFKEDDDYF